MNKETKWGSATQWSIIRFSHATAGPYTVWTFSHLLQTGMNAEGNLLREISQAQKDLHYSVQLISTESWQIYRDGGNGPQGWGSREWTVGVLWGQGLTFAGWKSSRNGWWWWWSRTVRMYLTPMSCSVCKANFRFCTITTCDCETQAGPGVRKSETGSPMRLPGLGTGLLAITRLQTKPPTEGVSDTGGRKNRYAGKDLFLHRRLAKKRIPVKALYRALH